MARRRRPRGTHPKRSENSPRSRKLPKYLGPRSLGDHQDHGQPQGQTADARAVEGRSAHRRGAGKGNKARPGSYRCNASCRGRWNRHSPTGASTRGSSSMSTRRRLGVGSGRRSGGLNSDNHSCRFLLPSPGDVTELECTGEGRVHRNDPGLALLPLPCRTCMWAGQCPAPGHALGPPAPRRC